VGERVAETRVVGLGLTGVSDLGVEVGVISVGEAMVLEKEKGERVRESREFFFFFSVVVVRRKKRVWVFATWPYPLIFGFGFWMRKQPMVCKL